MVRVKQEFPKRRIKDYCFTINNYNPRTPQDLTGLFDVGIAQYIVFGFEGKGEGHTPHIQGFVRWHTARTFSATKKKLGDGVHIEARKGTLDQAITYCKKEGDYDEHGERPVDPKSTNAALERWKSAFQYAKDGDFENIPYDIRFRYYGVIQRINSAYCKRPSTLEQIDNYWYWGLPGTGKSLKARVDYPDYYLKNTNKWWDGYQGEDTVIIDEVEKTDTYLGHFLKIWGDRYAFNGEIKGSSKYIRPKRIIVTSNYNIRDIFGDDLTLVAALYRRFKVIHFNLPLAH